MPPALNIIEFQQLLSTKGQKDKDEFLKSMPKGDFTYADLAKQSYE